MILLRIIVAIPIVFACLSLVKAEYYYGKFHYFNGKLSTKDLAMKLCNAFALDYVGAVAKKPNYYRFKAPRTEHSIYEGSVMTYIKGNRSDPQAKWHNIARSLKYFDEIPQSKTYSSKFFKNELIMRDSNLDYNIVSPVELLMKEFDITSPLFVNQWHIYNRDNRNHDVNVIPVWRRNITGKGVTIAIVDDGLERWAPDFNDRFVEEASYNFEDDRSEVSPEDEDNSHGTACGGLAAASKHGKCGVGIAFDASISAIVMNKLMYNKMGRVDMNYEDQLNDIYSCSWGDSDDGKSTSEDLAFDKSVKNGVVKGRMGRGSIYVFAAGNEDEIDNCSFDTYVNSIYTIGVGAISKDDKVTDYSEGCSSLMIVTYGGTDNTLSDKNQALVTTGLEGACDMEFTGTSGATPIVSGAIALMLQARSNLGWRDIQNILINTAIPIDQEDPSWSSTFLGLKFSNRYGYGKLDIFKSIKFLEKYKNLPLQRSLGFGNQSINRAIPNNGRSLTINIKVKPNKKICKLEHVTLTIELEHSERKDMKVVLISPHNILSELIVPRPTDHSFEGFSNFTVMSLKHWGEPVIGTWMLKFTDTNQHNPFSGKLNSFRVKFYGTRS